MKSDFSITISGGKYKGKKLHAASLETTRSTKSIMKGSLFDTLQFDIVGETMVEVFGGSGSIGLEAISRGADFAYFIEKDPAAYRVLAKNCSMIDRARTKTLLGDSFERYIEITKELLANSRKAYFYFDPPFDIRDGFEDIYHKTLALIEKTPKEIVLSIMIEHATATPMPEMIGDYKLVKSKKFGKSTLTYYAPKILA